MGMMQESDRTGAATMLQTAAKTALQIGDKGAATVLQTSATRLQPGENFRKHSKNSTLLINGMKVLCQGAKREKYFIP